MIDVDKVAAGAARLGKAAAQLGKAAAACPYDPQGTPRERVQAGAWMRAFLHWRPPRGAVDYGADDE